MKWPRIRSRRTTEVSPWVSLIAREVECSRGAKPQVYHAVEQPDYTSIVALTRSGKIPIVRQYRPALEACVGVASVARSLVRAVAYRDGPGDWLAEGVLRCARRAGPDTEPYAMHSKGLEMVSFDPRASAGQGLAYAVSPLGPRYDVVEHDIDFDPVDGHPYAIAAMRAYGLRGALPMTALDTAKVRNTAVLVAAWSGLDALNVCLYAGPPVRLYDTSGPGSDPEDGLPASVQLIGRPGDDRVVLAAGKGLEQALRA